MGRRSALLAGLVAVALAAIAAWRWGAALTLFLGLAAPAADSWIAGVRAAPFREEISIPAESGLLTADLYRPARPRGALLLIHGLSQAGRRQPDLARLASPAGQHGVLVVVPQFEGLAAFKLSGREVRPGARFVHRGPQQVVGHRGFQLRGGAGAARRGRCARSPRGRSFGGYAELTHVIGFVTTGEHSDGAGDMSSPRNSTTAGNSSRCWPDSFETPGIEASGCDRPAETRVARRRTREIEASLGPEGRAMLAVVRNTREDAVAPLLSGSPRTRATRFVSSPRSQRSLASTRVS